MHFPSDVDYPIDYKQMDAMKGEWVKTIQKNFPSLDSSDKIMKFISKLADTLGFGDITRETSISRSFIRAMMAKKAIQGKKMDLALNQFAPTADPEIQKNAYAKVLAFASLIYAPIASTNSAILNYGLNALEIGNSKVTSYLSNGLQFIGKKIMKAPVALVLKPMNKIAQLRVAMKEWMALKEDANEMQVENALANLVKSAVDASKEGIKVLATMRMLLTEGSLETTEQPSGMTIKLITGAMALVSASIGLWQLSRKLSSKQAKSTGVKEPSVAEKASSVSSDPVRQHSSGRKNSPAARRIEKSKNRKIKSNKN